MTGGRDLARGRLDRHGTGDDRRGAARGRHDGDRHGDRDRLDDPDLGGQVGVVEEAAGERGAGLAMRLEEAEQLGEPRRPVLAVGDDGGQPDGLARSPSASAATWRPVGS